MLCSARGIIQVPLLRGPVDPSTRRYVDIEEALGKNLDSWLCHLYFRCQPLPPYSRGQVEFELQLEHAAALLGGQKNEAPRTKPSKHAQLWGASVERGKGPLITTPECKA